MKKVLLGNTGLAVSQVGFGALPIGPGQLALPVARGAEIMRYAIDSGINFIDTAQYYRTYPYIKEALSGLDPEKAEDIVISSKSLACDYDGMKEAVSEALASLSRTYIDIFLMHEVRSGQLSARKGAWRALIDAKSEGLVKAIGISTHHVDITETASSMADLDVIFPLINYAGLGIRYGDRFATADEMLTAIKACRKAGKGVYAMKAFGGGSLTATYQKALNYVFSKEEIQSVMIGFGSESEIDDIRSYLDGTMAKDYNPDVSKKRVRISGEDCEGCGSCKRACPNGAIFWNENGLAEVNQEICLTCGYCIPACPVRAVIMY